MPANVIYSILMKKENAHDDPIYCCDWVRTSNNSSNTTIAAKDFIVTGGLDGLVKVWVLLSNKLDLLHTLDGHTMGVMSVAICPAARTIVSASLDSNLILWHLETGTKITELATGESDVWKVAYSPDGEFIATGGHTGKVYLYGTNDGDINKVFDTRGKFILSIDWTRNCEFIATGSEDGTVCILDVYQGKVLHTLEAHLMAVRSVAFSPCCKYLATASNDGLVKIYGVISATLQCQLEHKSWAVSVGFSPDGSRVVTGAADGSVRVAQATDLKLLNTFQEHTDTVWGVHFDGFSNKVVSVSKDGSIILYECPPLTK